MCDHSGGVANPREQADLSETIALPVPEEPDRLCSVCNTVKPAEEFHRAGPGKRKSRCASCRAALRPRQAARPGRKHDPEARRTWGRVHHLKAKYGITVEQYERMLASQGGGCAICGRPPGQTKHAVDHCHASGRVRALLCAACNRSLGYYEFIRERAEKYMAEYGQGNPLLDYDSDRTP